MAVKPHPPVLLRLMKDHRRMGRLLNALEQAAQGDPNNNDDVDWTTINDMLTYLSGYPEAVHHPVEDVLFGQLLSQALTSQQHQAVVDNAEQHKQIGAATKTLSQHVNAILNDIVVPVSDVDEALTAYISLQEQHMDHENSVIFPLAQACLSDRDWASVECSLLAVEDPMFDQRAEQFRRLYDYLMNPQP